MNDRIKKLTAVIFVILVVSIVLNFFGCPGAKRDELEFMRSQVDSLRVGIKDFLVASNKMSYDNYVHGKNLNLNSLYKKCSKLFTHKNIDLLNDLLKVEQRPERRERLERLKVFIYSEIVRKATSKLSDRIENTKSESFIDTEKGSIPFYNMFSLIANEPRQSKRARYYKSLNNFYKTLNSNYIDYLSKQEKIIIDSLRFNSYNQFSAMIRSEDFLNFKLTVEGFLNSTNDLYFTLLDDILRINKLNRDNFYRYDIYRILRSEKFDKYFKKDSLISIWKKSFTAMGIEIDSIRNLRVDLENRLNPPASPARQSSLYGAGGSVQVRRAGKNPRAACFAIDIPINIRMSVKPIGGFDDYAALFHETGHSLHYVQTTEEFLEFQYFGNSTATESYAFLIENLLDEAGWLKQFVGMKTSDIKSFIKFRTFQRLYMVRRYCAKYLYEYQLHDSQYTKQQLMDGDKSLNIAPKKYSEILSSILGYKAIPSDENFYLDDVDEFFYVVDYLRAWFIEAMFKTKLRELFGNEWYSNNALGSYLKDFFQYGQRYSIDEFIRKIGFIEIDPKFLSNEINSLRDFARRRN